MFAFWTFVHASYRFLCITMYKRERIFINPNELTPLVGISLLVKNAFHTWRMHKIFVIKDADKRLVYNIWRTWKLNVIKDAEILFCNKKVVLFMVPLQRVHQIFDYVQTWSVIKAKLKKFSSLVPTRTVMFYCYLHLS